jgi:hypothetical protein
MLTPDDLGEGRQLQPRDFETLARSAVEQIANLWGSGQYLPPFEIMFTDATNRLMMGIRMDEEGAFKNLPHTPYALRGYFPLTVTLVDKNGKIWKTLLKESDLAT